MSDELDPDSGETVPENASLPFPNPCETAQDYDAQAQGRIASQYRDDTPLKAMISFHASLFQALEDCAVEIAKLRDPAVATGVNLDVTGELVGQSRVLLNGTELSDADFRTWIAQRILRNKSIGSGPEFVAALEAVFGATPFRFVDLGDMALLLEIGTGARPDSDTIALLDGGPMPRPMAVGITRDWYDPTNVFGFEGDPDAKGFTEIGDATKGGKFAELF